MRNNAKGFLEHSRRTPGHRTVEERIMDFNELNLPLSPEAINEQAARCMDCGIPFCHGVGCPLDNNIPEFNEYVYKGKWQQACENLHSTNNFPEFTGRVCPAPCETACTLGINDEPVTIRHIEFQIVEKGFEEGWITPILPREKTGKKIAVIGSGPAGLSAAQQLVRAGHEVTVYEKDNHPGGLLRFGIPDFKLDKQIVERRIDQMKAEGVEFECGVEVGKDISANYLERTFDCLCITMGAGQPRDIEVQGRELKNILFAMDYLGAQNSLVSGDIKPEDLPANAKGKDVVVIGGGDTGSDCVGTARRQGANKIYQFEILPKPPEKRPPETPWPTWPKIMRTSSSHEEGCDRRWSIMTKEFGGIDSGVTEIKCRKIEWIRSDNNWQLRELPDSDFTVRAELVLLAMGFTHVVHKGIVEELGLELDKAGNIITNNGQTNLPDVFAAGDAATGASLVVRAIDEGRKVAERINTYLTT